MRTSFVNGTFAWSEEDDHAVIEMTAEQSLLADELGFSAILFPEKHFNGYLPASADPMMSAAYLAPQLKQAYLGFAILAAAFFHPANVVERINLLDHYTRGRLLLGIGSGIEIEAMAGFGLKWADVQSSGLREFFEVAERLWEKKADDPPYEFETTYYRGTIYERIHPRPFSQPRPRLVGVGMREESIARAAEQGWPVFIPAFDGLDNFVGRLRHYGESLAAAGHDADIQRTCMAWTSYTYNAVFVADTDAEAERLMRDALTSHVEAMDRLEQRTRIQARAADGVGGGFKPFTKDFEHDLRTRCLFGSPDTVVAELSRLAELGVGNAIMSFNVGVYTEERRRAFDRSIRLYAEEVMPRVEAIAAPASTDELIGRAIVEGK
ncbi:MAG: LLM class flavin-dependent oxidoreductase [Microbacterium sp.]|uniref:LLM class flavin-dependent oxidoreductase n=1 Tax=Microbacterium sp. TaxID=51671 RepID=UPI0039E3542F